MRPSLLLFGAAPRPPLSMLLHFLCQHVNEHFCRPCGGIAARISAALAFFVSFIPPPAARLAAGVRSRTPYRLAHVENIGVEPMTSCLQSRRSSQLS